MFRILWADDQADVAKTLSSLLSPLKAKITIVTSGEDAINSLRQSNYDLLVLDLSMPPGKWGGIWALEELSKLSVKLPVLVLSGEGTQSETIKALRLGARDYVTKDTAHLELYNRVDTLIRNATIDAKSKFVSVGPTPLAIPCKRYLSTSTSVSRLRRLIEFVETTLKYVSIIGLCELSKKPLSALQAELVAELKRGPSMGTWYKCRGSIGKLLESTSVFSVVDYAFTNVPVPELIQLRNDISHGSEPSEKFAGDELQKWEPFIDMMIYRLYKGQHHQVIVPQKLAYDGALFQTTGIELVGDSPSLPSISVVTSQPLISSHTYVISPEAGKGEVTDLHPLLIFEPATNPSSWNGYMFDSVRNARSTSNKGSAVIRYSEIWSGSRNSQPAILHTDSELPVIFNEDLGKMA